MSQCSNSSNNEEMLPQHIYLFGGFTSPYLMFQTMSKEWARTSPALRNWINVKFTAKTSLISWLHKAFPSAGVGVKLICALTSHRWIGSVHGRLQKRVTWPLHDVFRCVRLNVQAQMCLEQGYIPNDTRCEIISTVQLPRKRRHRLQLSLCRVESRWTWCEHLPVNGRIAIGAQSPCAFDRPHVLRCVVLDDKCVFQLPENILHAWPEGWEWLSAYQSDLKHSPHGLWTILSFYARIHHLFDLVLPYVRFCLHDMGSM